MMEIATPNGQWTLDDEAAEAYAKLPATTYCCHGTPRTILGKPVACEKCESEKKEHGK